MNNMRHLKTFNESIKDKMVAKPFEDIFTYNSFRPILKSFVEETDERIENDELDILIGELPTLLNTKLEDLRYFVIKEDLFTENDKGQIVQVKSYVDTLDFYTKGDEPEIVKIPGLQLIQTVLVFKDKKVAIIHAIHGSMIVIDKNIFN